MNISKSRKSQSGVATVEFALTAAAFFMMLIVVVAGGLLFWTKNALVETTRRAARFAATQPANTPAGTLTSGTDVGPSVTAIKNVALYGNPAGTGSKLVENLQESNITIVYSDFGVNTGTVSVAINNFTYHFTVPGINQQPPMPNAQTTVRGESAGTLP